VVVWGLILMLGRKGVAFFLGEDLFEGEVVPAEGFDEEVQQGGLLNKQGLLSSYHPLQLEDKGMPKDRDGLIDLLEELLLCLDHLRLLHEALLLFLEVKDHF
jgi:hypothetical protein